MGTRPIANPVMVVGEGVPNCRIVFRIVNPGSGGGLGKEIGARQEAELREGLGGWHAARLVPETGAVALGGDQRLSLREYLGGAPAHGRHILSIDTLSGSPATRIGAMQAPLSVLAKMGLLNQTLVTTVSGDGVHIEAKRACLQAAGLDYRALMEGRLDRSQIDEIWGRLPLFDAESGGTACDIPHATGANKRENIVDRLVRCHVVYQPTMVAEVHTEQGPVLEDVSHSWAVGGTGALFVEAEKSKGSWWGKGNRLPYFRAAAAVVIGKALAFIRRSAPLTSKPDPLDPFWVHYTLRNGTGEKGRIVESCDVRVLTQQMSGGVMYTPDSPVRGAAALFMPASTSETLLVNDLEVIFRGLVKLATGNDVGYSVLLGNRHVTLDRDRAVKLVLGSRISIRLFTKQFDGDLFYTSSQLNGEPASTSCGADILAADPVPYLATSESLAARREKWFRKHA